LPTAYSHVLHKILCPAEVLGTKSSKGKQPTQASFFARDFRALWGVLV
jgi:hypothetical protein